MKWQAVYNLTKRELHGFIFSPVAYVVAIVFFVISAVFFWTTFFLQNQAELRNYFSMLPWLCTFIIPALTMKQFAEERQTGSYEMLATLPISLEEIIAGKFLAIMVFLTAMLTIIPLYGFSIELVGDLNWGTVWGGFLGAFFLSAFYASIGLFASSLTKNQVIAFIVGLCLALFFFLIGKLLAFLPQSTLGFFSFFSSDLHFRNITKGLLDIRDVLFFVFFGYFFLWLTHFNLKRSA